MCLVLVATDASYLVMYITRYTEESFSTLISLIFITDGIKKLLSIYKHSPVDTAWSTTTVTTYACQCFTPIYNGVVESWTENLSEADWVRNASSKIILHGKEHAPERYWRDESSFHCIYLNDYQSVNVGNVTWSDLDTESCRSHCGVLDGSACPLYRDIPNFSSITNETERALLQSAASHEGVELSPQIIDKYHIKQFGMIFTPDVFLFSIFLAIGTLAISFTLKGLKQVSGHIKFQSFTRESV